MRKPEEIKIGKRTLKEILDTHADWIKNPQHGKRANLDEMDLSGVNLERVNLTGADLRNTKLNESNLNKASMAKANMRGALLNNASLRQINLHSADLRSVTFKGSDLSYSKLESAYLRDADFTRCNLHSINLKGAILENVYFGESNLSGADLGNTTLEAADFNNATFGLTKFYGIPSLSLTINLDTCIHIAPSFLDINSIPFLDKLPFSFMKGVGFNDTFLNYYPSIFTGNPIQYYSCFISYSSKDADLAQRLKSFMQDEGLRTWFAPDDLKWGAKTREAIDNAIKIYDKLLIVLSEDSIESQWVEQEVESALEKERKGNRTILFPVRIDDSVFDVDYGWAKLIKNTRNIGDFTKWKDHDKFTKSFKRLVRDLKKEMG